MLRRVWWLILILGLAGCTTDQGARYVLDNAPGLIEVPEPPGPVAAGSGLIFEDVSLEQKARSLMLARTPVIDKENDHSDRKANSDIIIRPDNSRLYPYGLAQAQLTCFKMLFCNVVLQDGERVMDLASGDTVRWQTKVSYIGNAEKFTAVVMVKPFFGGLTTNLSIITDRRAYNIILNSIEKGEYMPGIGFYYPQEAASAAALPAPPATKSEPRSNLPFEVEKLHFDYVLSGNQSLPWYPLRVFDDGTKVYIKMPAVVSSRELPVFIARNEQGQGTVVNYRYKAPYFIIDQLFTRGELVLGVGSAQSKIVIRKK